MTKNFLKKARPGFTLIELLIVMMIMTILTVVAVGNFAGVQRQARIGFAADTLVASLREAQLLAKSGRRVGAVDDSSGNSPGKLQCFAVKIADGAVLTAQSDYIGLPDLGGGSSAGKIDTCTVVDESVWQQKEIFDGDITIRKITSGADEVESQEFYYKPPFGQLYANISGTLASQKDGVFTYLVGVEDHPEFNITVQYDVSTGEVNKVASAPV